MKKETLRISKNSSLSHPIIDERNYIEVLKGTVLPQLDELRRIVMLPREGSQKLYCEYFPLPEGTCRGSVFISHGFTESCGKYHEVIWYFLQAGYSVCMIEHRGHGRSRREGVTSAAHVPTTIQHFRDYTKDFRFAVRTVLCRKLPAPYYLFAHSMGGAIASDFLEQYPGTFQKAVLSAPMMEYSRGGLPKPVVRLVTGAGCALGLGEHFMPGQSPFDPNGTFESSAALSQPRWRYYFEQQLAEPLFQSGGSSFRWAFECMKADDRILRPENCAKIKIPVLLFQAEKDTFVLPGGQNRFIERIPNGRLVFVPKAKHEIYLSSNDILAPYWDLIFSFLEK